MADVVEVPLTIVEETVLVPVTEGSSTYIRESGDEPSAKVSQFTLAVLADLLSTDVVPVARPNVHTKKTTLATLAAFLSSIAVGPALLQEDIDASSKKISELTEKYAADLTENDVIALVNGGETCKLKMIELQQFLMSLRTSPIAMVFDLVNGRNIGGPALAANSAKIQAKADELSPENGGKGGILYIPGQVEFHGIRLHPAVHPMGDGRKSTEWVIGNNCPITTGDRRIGGVVVPDADAEARALFYVLARAPYVPGQVTVTQATDAWLTHFCHATINGNKGNQSGNWVAGVYCEGGESDPHFDEVSGGTGNAKAYSGFASYDMEVHACSGDGWYAGGERQRCYAHFTRSLNHGIVTTGVVTTVAAGWRMKGNDSIVGPRCGGGGSTDSAVIFAGPSGVNVTQGNFWPGDLAATNAATVLSATGCNGICIHGNTFNGNVYLNSSNAGTDYRKAVSCVGNETRIADELFNETDHLSGNPYGLLDATRNAAYTVRGYKQVALEGNGVSVDKFGNSFMRLVYASVASGGIGAATGTLKFAVSTQPGVKPWAGADNQAFELEAGCSFLCELTDSYRQRRYISGGTVIGSGAAFFNSGGTPSDTGHLRVDGALALKRAVHPMTSGVNLTLTGEPVVWLTAASTIAALPLFMPVPRCQDHEVTVIAKQTITALTVAITPGQQDRPTDSGSLQNVVLVTTGLPSTIPAGAMLVFHYDRPTTTWLYSHGHAALT